ncbi:MAG: phosphodiester glycosidase family protein, partial [Clostridia bacterium]
MKLRNTAISIVLAIMLVIPLVTFPASAAIPNATETKSFNVVDGMVCKQYDVTATAGDKAGSEFVASTLEFSPKNFIPVVYSCWAGSAANLKTQYDYAVKKNKYDVAAVVNGSFFSMDSGANKYGNYGILNGMVISNGKIASTHAGYSGNLVAFDSDGSIHFVNSCITYKLFFNGSEIKNAIYYINKFTGDTQYASTKWSDKFYYFDSSCGTTADTNKLVPGYEILCQKINSTELTVGGTMQAKVLEVKENSYGTKFENETYNVSDKFVLFVKNGSSYAEYAKNLKVGDTVDISAEESIPESKKIMENANSVIENVGFLVKDGVDQTKLVSTIGSHSVTLMARWTAFGVKADGTYVFYTSEGGATGVGGALTLKDVAKNMIDMGCVNVIRMDGGGSSAMYLCNDGTTNTPGYIQKSSRSVGDCILIVKRSSMADPTLVTALDEALKKAEASLAKDPSNLELKAAYDEAKAIKASPTSVSGDIRHAIMILGKGSSSIAKLDMAITLASSIKYSNYSATELEKIWQALLYAKAVRSTPDATNDAIIAAAIDLTAAVNIERNLILGGTVLTSPKYGSYSGIVNDGKIAITPYDSLWAGFYYTTNPAAKDKNNFDGNVGEIIVDLGSKKDMESFRTHIRCEPSAGISEIAKIEVLVSDDNKTYTSVASTTTDPQLKSAEPGWVNFDKPASGRYVKFTYQKVAGVFMFVSEVEAYEKATKVSNVGWVDGFNTKILDSNAFIFTPDKTPVLTGEAANVNWAQTLILQWDDTAKGYKIVATKGVDGTPGPALKANQIAIGVHASDNPNDPKGSPANKVYAATGKIGDFVEFHGIYIDKKDALGGGYFKIVSQSSFNKVFGGILGDVWYDIPTTALKGIINLVPEQNYDKTDAGGGTITYEFKDGKFILKGNGGWPCVSTVYTDPLAVKVEGTTIEIDFKVETGYTAIFLDLANGQQIKLHQNIGATDDKYDAGSGDLKAGSYKVKVPLSTIKASDGTLTGTEALKIGSDGKVIMTSITIYATSNAVVTINSIKLDIPTGKPAVKPDSGLTLNGNLLEGVKPGMTAEELAKLFVNQGVKVEGVDPKTNKVGTGCKVIVAGVTFTVVVKGDTTGDGLISPMDYLAVRMHIIGLKPLTNEFELAAHANGGKTVSAMDYLAIRLHLIGIKPI